MKTNNQLEVYRNTRLACETAGSAVAMYRYHHQAQQPPPTFGGSILPAAIRKFHHCTILRQCTYQQPAHILQSLQDHQLATVGILLALPHPRILDRDHLW